jgi:holo-[acyl-carrier protein] synthase
MIAGIGVDIVEVAAIESSIRDYGENYLTRVFTSREIAYCKSVGTSGQRYAARVAAKEAAMKALSTGWDAGVQWLDFEVVNEASGQPILVITGTAGKLLAERRITNTWVSLAHVPEYAIAQVVFES